MTATAPAPRKEELTKEQRTQIREAIKAFKAALEAAGVQPSDAPFHIISDAYNDYLDLVSRAAEQILFEAGTEPSDDDDYKAALQQQKEKMATELGLALNLKRNEITTAQIAGGSIKFWKTYKEANAAYWARFKANKK